MQFGELHVARAVRRTAPITELNFVQKADKTDRPSGQDHASAGIIDKIRKEKEDDRQTMNQLHRKNKELEEENLHLKTLLSKGQLNCCWFDAVLAIFSAPLFSLVHNSLLEHSFVHISDSRMV